MRKMNPIALFFCASAALPFYCPAMTKKLDCPGALGLSNRTNELGRTLQMAVMGEGKTWAGAAAETESLAAKIKSGQEPELLAALQEKLGSNVPAESGMSGLVLIESGYPSDQALLAITDLLGDPGMQNQKWRNNTSSASCDFRIRAMNALCSPKNNLKRTEDVLVELLSGQKSDAAFFFAQIEAAYILHAPTPPPALVKAVARVRASLHPELPKDRESVLLSTYSDKAAVASLNDNFRKSKDYQGLLFLQEILTLCSTGKHGS